MACPASACVVHFSFLDRDRARMWMNRDLIPVALTVYFKWPTLKSIPTAE